MNWTAVSFDAEASSEITLGSLGNEKLERIYKVIGQEDNTSEAKELFDLMSLPWSKYGHEVKWGNDLSDDGSPFEFSIVFKGHKTTPIVRFLVEPQELPFTLKSNWKAGLALKERLQNLDTVDVSKLTKVQDIFSPLATGETHTPFSIWYAAILEPKNPQLKVYLNPQIRGEENAFELVKQAFLTLNAERNWSFLSEHFNACKNFPKILYFSLDLSAGETARIKVYIASKSLKDIEDKLQGCLLYTSGSASKWIQTLTNQEIFERKPIQITYNFTSERDRPVPTIHLPIRSYIENDEMAVERMKDFLSQEQINTLKEIITTISGASLKDEKALTYVSFRPSAVDQFDVYCYIAPCIYTEKGSRNNELRN